VTTRRRSSRAPRAVESTAATSEPPRGAAVAMESWHEVLATAVATAAATATPVVPPAPVPAAGDQAPVVDIPDDDAPLPGWGQWEIWPAPAPEPAAGVLVMREDGCVVPRQLTRGAEASSSRAVLPAPDVTVARPEQEWSTPARCRPTSTMPRPSRRCGKSFETTTPRSTMR
jgi:hypothetical protein